MTPHGGGSGGGLSWNKSQREGEKNGCGGCSVCGRGAGCIDGLCGVLFLTLFGVLVADFLVTFDGRGSGSRYCGFRFGVDEEDVVASCSVAPGHYLELIFLHFIYDLLYLCCIIIWNWYFFQPLRLLGLCCRATGPR